MVFSNGVLLGKLGVRVDRLPTANCSVSVVADEQGEKFFSPKTCSTGSELQCEMALGTQAVQFSDVHFQYSSSILISLL